MLHVLLLILKVIGCIILVILGIILLILAIVLISPFRYQLAGEAGWEEKVVKAQGKITWLLHLIRVDIKFEDMTPAWRVKLAWFTLLQDGFEEEKKNVEDKKNEGKDDELSQLIDEIFEEDSGNSEPIQIPSSGDKPDSGKTESGEGKPSGYSEDSGSFRSSEGKPSGYSEDSGNIESGEGKPSGCSEDSGNIESGEGEPSRYSKDSGNSGSGEGESSREGDDSGISSDRIVNCQGKGQPDTSPEENAEKDHEEKEENVEEETSKISIQFKKIKEIILRIYEKIKTPFQKIERFQASLEEKLDSIERKFEELTEKKDEIMDFIDNKTHKKAFFKVLKCIRYLLRKYLPRKGEIDIHFGLDDPYLTGLVYAILSVIDPLTGGNIYGTPEPDRFVLEGKVNIKGRIRLVHILIILLRLAITPSVWKTFFDGKKLSILNK